ncbi:carboxymuconolactone decarboxylase family protein [Streptomyces sp. NPDC049555]|uniref:carboxymuconolactone decarboxylase family protein n=1 Tax=Streptomyces sp. NPDC049555 TaxID=3154930 RepID=UPI00341E61AC
MRPGPSTSSGSTPAPAGFGPAPAGRARGPEGAAAAPGATVPIAGPDRGAAPSGFPAAGVVPAPGTGFPGAQPGGGEPKPVHGGAAPQQAGASADGSARVVGRGTDGAEAAVGPLTGPGATFRLGPPVTGAGPAVSGLPDAAVRSGGRPGADGVGHAPLGGASGPGGAAAVPHQAAASADGSAAGHSGDRPGPDRAAAGPQQAEAGASFRYEPPAGADRTSQGGGPTGEVDPVRAGAASLQADGSAMTSFRLGPPVPGAGKVRGERAPQQAGASADAASGVGGLLPDAVPAGGVAVPVAAGPEAPRTARPFGAAYEEFVERFARGGPWARPGLDPRTRYLVTLTALAVGGHTGELAAYARAALRAGVSAEEIEETLLQAAPYCGLPAVGAAFDAVGRVMAEEAGT